MIEYLVIWFLFSFVFAILISRFIKEISNSRIKQVRIFDNNRKNAEAFDTIEPDKRFIPHSVRKISSN